MAADDQAANQAHEGVEAIPVQGLPALPSRRSLFGGGSAALVPAAAGLPAKGGPQPEPCAHSELQVREPRGQRGRRSEQTSPRAGPSTRADASPRSRCDGGEESRPGRLSSSAAEVPLALVEGWSLVFPAPGCGGGLCGHAASAVEVHPFSGELLRGGAQGGRPARVPTQDRVLSANSWPAERANAREQLRARSSAKLGPEGP